MYFHEKISFLVPVCPEGSIASIKQRDPLAALVFCEANSTCIDQGQESPLRCYNANQLENVDLENLNTPLCENGKVPHPCNGCADGSQRLHCPEPTHTCQSNAFQLNDVPRWCGK